MKILHYLIVAAFIFSIPACAPLKDYPAVAPIHFQGTVNLGSSYDTRTLYLNAKRWFSQSFYEPDYVIKMDEPEELMGRGYTYILIPTGHEDQKALVELEFSVSIRFREGRYKYDIGTLTIGEKQIPAEQASNDAMYPNKNNKKAIIARAYRSEINRVMPAIEADLKKAMSTGPITGDDKW